MNRVATFLLILLVLVVASCGRQQAPQGSTVVLVVRHADKASDAEDSPLSDAGLLRAQALASVAAGANVGAIYITQFKRNHDTAQPLAIPPSGPAGLIRAQYGAGAAGGGMTMK